MSKESFPKRIAVSLDWASAESEDLPDVFAWASLKQADDGELAIYELVEVIEKKTVPKIRSGKSKQWAETEELDA